MRIADNAKAFIGAAMLVVIVSLALVQFGVIGNNDSGPGSVAGNPQTITPAALGQSQTPVTSSVPATPSPTEAPSAGPPLTATIDVPILMYHRVLPELPANEFDAALAVTTTDLEDQLTYLRCAGYTTTTMGRLLAAFDGTEALPRDPIILTFDDGWVDDYTNLFPMLQAHGMTASLAIVTSYVGQPAPYVTWDQIKVMYDAGVEMMSHTVSHLDLGSLDDAGLRDQVFTSKVDLEQHLGRPVDTFVYPAGEPFRSGTADQQQRVVAALRTAGYRAALLDGTNTLTQDPSAPYELNRVRVSGGEDLATFAASIGGPAPDSLSCP